MGKKIFEFDKSKVIKVAIDKVIPNTWNPKTDNPKEFENIKKSLRVNGYAQPIMVREKGDKYEVIDGEHRLRAAKELGYQEIYIYNNGQVSDEDAQAMTLFMQTQVPFDEIELAPLVVELSKANIELPYSEEQIIDFKNMAEFDFGEGYEEKEPEIEDPGMKTLKIQMTPEQFEVVNSAINLVMQEQNVSAGRALELLIGDAMAGYQQIQESE